MRKQEKLSQYEMKIARMKNVLHKAFSSSISITSLEKEKWNKNLSHKHRILTLFSTIITTNMKNDLSQMDEKKFFRRFLHTKTNFTSICFLFQYFSFTPTVNKQSSQRLVK
jgi:hypothetical protein